jgi:carbon monoxide dehydrogenase subunit G
MRKVTKTIEIEAAPEKVFAFLLDREKMNEASKGFSQYEYTSKGPVGVGTTMHYVTGSGGSTMEFDSEVVEFVRNEKFVSHTIGASKFKGKASFTLEPTAKGTKMTYNMEYELPYSVLGKLIDKLSVHKKMEEGISNALENGKKAIENS